MDPDLTPGDACMILRPFWDGAHVTALDELMIVMQTPVILLLIVATALAIRMRHDWGGLIVVVGWSMSTFLVVDWTGQNMTRTAAIDGGCIGNPALFIAVAAAVCIGVVLYTAPLKRGPN